MRFVKWQNVLALSSCPAIGYAENGAELQWKNGGGRRWLKRGNFCKWLVINRAALNYFLSLADLRILYRVKSHLEGHAIVAQSSRT